MCEKTEKQFELDKRTCGWPQSGQRIRIANDVRLEH